MNAEKSRLRIALVCNTAWAIYTYRRGLLRMLIERGVEVSVIAPRETWNQQLYGDSATAESILVDHSATTQSKAVEGLVAAMP